MIEILNSILPYITGLWTLPWIVIGFVINIFLSKIFGDEKINIMMKKIGLILLFIFVPLLLFRIFLTVDFKETEIIFTTICFIAITLMYILSYLYAKLKIKKVKISDHLKNQYLRTIITNQGRSSAFVGSAMLTIKAWAIPAAIYMSIGAIFLFAIIPYLLSHNYKKKKSSEIHALPWFLKIFPWYLLIFAGSSILIHHSTGFELSHLGDGGIIFKFFTTLTIPAALYYVGAGIHPNDLKKNELKKIFNLKNNQIKNQLTWVKNIFFVTVIITPIFTAFFLVLFFILKIIPSEWFSVLLINSILPITSTNMFLVPYGINKKITAISITWTTIICIPIVVALITLFGTIFN